MAPRQTASRSDMTGSNDIYPSLLKAHVKVAHAKVGFSRLSGSIQNDRGRWSGKMPSKNVGKTPAFNH